MSQGLAPAQAQLAGITSSGNLDPPVSGFIPSPTVVDSKGDKWLEHRATDGTVYFSNARTHEIVWQRPEGAVSTGGVGGLTSAAPSLPPAAHLPGMHPAAPPSAAFGHSAPPSLPQPASENHMTASSGLTVPFNTLQPGNMAAGPGQSFSGSQQGSGTVVNLNRPANGQSSLFPQQTPPACMPTVPPFPGELSVFSVAVLWIHYW